MSKQTVDREQQGQLIAQIKGSIKRISDKNYIVSSQSGNGSYDVHYTELGFGHAGGPLLKQFAILMSSLATAISISLILTGPGKISIEWNVLKREVFPRGKHIIQNLKDQDQ